MSTTIHHWIGHGDTKTTQHYIEQTPKQMCDAICMPWCESGVLKQPHKIPSSIDDITKNLVSSSSTSSSSSSTSDSQQQHEMQVPTRAVYASTNRTVTSRCMSNGSSQRLGMFLHHIRERIFIRSSATTHTQASFYPVVGYREGSFIHRGNTVSAICGFKKHGKPLLFWPHAV